MSEKTDYHDPLLDTGQVMTQLGWSDEAIAAAIEAQRKSDVVIQQATPPPVELGAAVKTFENKKEVKCVPRWSLTSFMLTSVIASSSILLTGVAIGQNGNAEPAAATSIAPVSAEGNVQAPTK